MSYLGQVRSMRVIALMAILAVSAAARAQSNPYHVVEGWPTLPPDIKWGAVISVDVDAKGNTFGGSCSRSDQNDRDSRRSCARSEAEFTELSNIPVPASVRSGEPE